MKNINSLCIKDALFITLKPAQVSIPQTFGSFPSRRRPIKAPFVWLPAPTHPSAGQQQYGDGSWLFSYWAPRRKIMIPWLPSHTYTQKQKPKLYFAFPSWRQWLIAGFRRRIELATDGVRCSPTWDAARFMGAWPLTVSSWCQHAFTHWTAFWKAACACGLLSGAGTHFA